MSFKLILCLFQQCAGLCASQIEDIKHLKTKTKTKRLEQTDKFAASAGVNELDKCSIDLCLHHSQKHFDSDVSTHLHLDEDTDTHLLII